jgi:hypothetical protein
MTFLTIILHKQESNDTIEEIQYRGMWSYVELAVSRKKSIIRDREG